MLYPYVRPRRSLDVGIVVCVLFPIRFSARIPIIGVTFLAIKHIFLLSLSLSLYGTLIWQFL